MVDHSVGTEDKACF